MAVITSSSFAKLLWPGLNAIYGKSYNDYPVEWDKLFEKNTSDKAYEEDVGLSSFGLASVKNEGAPITYDTERQGFTSRYNHVVYALGFMITREIYEDDQYAKVGAQKAKALARSMRQTKEIVAANVYNNATSGSFLGGDGKALLATDHPNVAGGTFSNRIAVDSDLSEAALEQSVIDIAGFRDDRGLLIAAKPQKLVIPYTLQFEASRIFSTVITNHYLTDPDAWFILTNVGDGLKYFERRGDQFEMDNDFDTENAKFKATARYSFGWSDPRAIYGSPGA